jgi:hypothetical protein
MPTMPTTYLYKTDIDSTTVSTTATTIFFLITRNMNIVVAVVGVVLLL